MNRDQIDHLLADAFEDETKLNLVEAVKKYSLALMEISSYREETEGEDYDNLTNLIEEIQAHKTQLVVHIPQESLVHNPHSPEPRVFTDFNNKFPTASSSSPNSNSCYVSPYPSSSSISPNSSSSKSIPQKIVKKVGSGIISVGKGFSDFILLVYVVYY
jgi:hypothetical protein